MRIRVFVLGAGLVDPATPVIVADDLGLTRGDGCFEGCRVVRTASAGVVDDLDAHLDRMARSASALDIGFDRAAWSDAVGELVADWYRGAPDEQEASLKLVLTRGPEHAPRPTGVLTLAPMAPAVLDARRRGISVVTLARGLGPQVFADSLWLLGGVKTLSYAVNVAAVREARRRGADDALFTSTDGSLLEGPTWSVVWLDGTTLTTVAPGANGILRSVTTERLLRSAAEAGFATRQGSGTPDDLRRAEVVLAVSSVRGPVRIRELDGEALLAPAEGGRGGELLALCDWLLAHPAV